MASSQRPKPPPLTHFLCIPLVTPTSRPQLSASLASFRDDVTSATDVGGFELPAEAVRPVGTLHLTLGMMSFPRSEGLSRAVELLQSLQPRETLAGLERPVMPGAAVSGEEGEGQGQQKTTPRVLLTLRGLHAMQKPEKTTVLFAPPSDPEGLLQQFAERIKAAFADAQLLVPDDRPLLLHATLVNTVYVRGGRNGPKGKGRKWERNVIRDAQAMMDRYEDQVWMDKVPLEKIAICRMGAKPVEEDGVAVDVAYEVEAEIDV